MFLMELDPNLSFNLATKLNPLLFNITVIAVIVSIIKTILKGDYSNLFIQLIVCSIILVLVKNPDNFLSFGNYIISLGGGLLEK